MKFNQVMLWTIAFGAMLAIIRVWIGFNIEPESITLAAVFKDTAHLFIGGLFVAWWLQRQRWQWVLFGGLNAVEVVTAVVSRL